MTAAADSLAARQAAAGEAARAAEVFDQFLNDRAAKGLPPATWAALQAGGIICSWLVTPWSVWPAMGIK